MSRLRRALNHVDWKSAVGEVALIIVGILVALAVDAWWDGRNDAATERAYLRQLLVDVEGNERAIGNLLSRHSAAVTDTSRLVVAFDAAEPLPPCNTMADLLFSALTWLPLELRTGTYAALLATGDIKLIRSDRLRAEVIRYAGVIDTVTRVSTQFENHAWAAAQTFRHQLVLSPLAKEFLWRLEHQPSDPPPWSGCDFEPLRQNREFREGLFTASLLNTNRIGSVKDLATANSALRSQIQAELKQ